MLLQDDPCKELRKDIYRNISKSELYRVAAKPLILLCLNVIEGMTRKVDNSNRNILNFKGKQVASYQPLQFIEHIISRNLTLKQLRNGYKVKLRPLII